MNITLCSNEIFAGVTSAFYSIIWVAPNNKYLYKMEVEGDVTIDEDSMTGKQRFEDATLLA